MLTWMIRFTPACRAAKNSAREFSTASANVVAPWSKRTQYVL